MDGKKISFKQYVRELDFRVFIKREDVRLFIGKNYDKYKETWLKDYSKKAAC